MVPEAVVAALDHKIEWLQLANNPLKRQGPLMFMILELPGLWKHDYKELHAGTWHLK